MFNFVRSMRGSMLAGAAALGLGACNLDVASPSVIDAATFDPNADGQTLSLSAQTNFYIAFQAVAQAGGLISEELWSGAARAQARRLSSRTFASTDDINARVFAPLSLAIASNRSAVSVLSQGASAATDVNRARSAMILGFSVELMAETMCTGVIQGGPELTDPQLLDTAITAFTSALTVAKAAGAAGTTIMNASNVGLARAYLQRGNYAAAALTAALVPASFTTDVVTSANLSTQSSLGNQFYASSLAGVLVAPARYRQSDARVSIDSTQPGNTQNGLPFIIQTKYSSYSDPIRLASGLEALYIVAEAQLHGSAATTTAIALINARRAAGMQSAYAGATDTLSVIAELLNQRARDFWLEGKKLGDLRRNPSVPFTSVLTDPDGAIFYANSAQKFGSNLCAPIPPEETNANPNFKP